MGLIRSLAEKRARKASQPNHHRMANLLRPYFSPASVFPPPGSTRGQTGGRNVTQSSENSPNTTPTDSTILAFIPHSGGAIAVWKFATGFTAKPSVTANAQKANTNGPQELNVIQITPQGAIIQSTDPADNRLVHVQAVQLASQS